MATPGETLGDRLCGGTMYETEGVEYASRHEYMEFVRYDWRSVNTDWEKWGYVWR